MLLVFFARSFFSPPSVKHWTALHFKSVHFLSDTTGKSFFSLKLSTFKITHEDVDSAIFVPTPQSWPTNTTIAYKLVWSGGHFSEQHQITGILPSPANLSLIPVHCTVVWKWFMRPRSSTSPSKNLHINLKVVLFSCRCQNSICSTTFFFPFQRRPIPPPLPPST